MDVLIKCTWILWQIIICECLEIKQEFFENNEEICQKHARDPYFAPDLVVGQPWRVYYTWNMMMGAKCFDMVFKNATKKTIKRIRTDMTDYMEKQPYWETAALHMSTTLGSSTHELLLFADQGPAGRFLAVPNMHDSDYTLSGARRLPLLKFLMKLIRNGRYLLVVDCYVGGGSLAARAKDRPYRADIASAAASLQLGEGHHACTGEKHKDEQLYLE